LKAVIEKAQLDADTKERDRSQVLEQELAKKASLNRSEPLEVKKSEISKSVEKKFNWSWQLGVGLILAAAIITHKVLKRN